MSNVGIRMEDDRCCHACIAKSRRQVSLQLLQENRTLCWANSPNLCTFTCSIMFMKHKKGRPLFFHLPVFRYFETSLKSAFSIPSKSVSFPWSSEHLLLRGKDRHVSWDEGLWAGLAVLPRSDELTRGSEVNGEESPMVEIPKRSHLQKPSNNKRKKNTTTNLHWISSCRFSLASSARCASCRRSKKAARSSWPRPLGWLSAENLQRSGVERKVLIMSVRSKRSSFSWFIRDIWRLDFAGYSKSLFGGGLMCWSCHGFRTLL